MILIACLMVVVDAVGEDGGEVKDMTDEYQTKSASFRRLLYNIRCQVGQEVRVSIQIPRGTKSPMYQARP